MPSNMLRHIPSVNELLESAPLRNLSNRVSRNVVVSGVRSFLDRMRHELQDTADKSLPAPAELAERIARWIVRQEQPPLRPVINATGILLHTGLGRAPLAEEAIEAMSLMSRGYCSLEVDLATGQRSQRINAVERLLEQLTGAEAAAVVNNNAAATLLTLTALGHGREVIVSRGELVEIGGSFRLPEVMTSSGAKLKEVGATNKTRLSDYQAAINENTAALMRVHTSNYKIVGFTQRVSLEDLVALGQERNIPVIDDVGSGSLVDFSQYGVSDEPIVSESVKAGADVVLFSGDKLLGGPQCGVIVGRRETVQKISTHPMMRAMRVDKLTLAALAATLRLYRDKQTLENSLPLLSLLTTPIENLKMRAERLAPQMESFDGVVKADPIESVAYLGGGSLPSEQISTWCVALTVAENRVDAFAEKLRTGSPSVFGRISNDRLLLDLRSVAPRWDVDLVEAVKQAAAKEPA